MCSLPSITSLRLPERVSGGSVPQQTSSATWQPSPELRSPSDTESVHQPQSSRSSSGGPEAAAYPYCYPVSSHGGSFPAFPHGQQSMAAMNAYDSTIVGSDRKRKQRARKACTNCKRAHFKCDDARPCSRCVEDSQQATCVDLPQKRKCSPRLRDVIHSDISPPSHFPAWQHLMGNRTTLTLPGLGLPHSSNQTKNISAVHQAHPFEAPSLPSSASYSIWNYDDNKQLEGPLAFLDLELNVLKTNDAFNRIFGLSGDSCGHNLSSFIEEEDLRLLRDIQSSLKRESGEKQSSFSNVQPMARLSDASNMPAVETHRIAKMSHAYEEKNEVLRFRLQDNRVVALVVSFRLAASSVTFVTLSLRYIIPSFGPDQYLQTPRHEFYQASTPMSEIPRPSYNYPIAPPPGQPHNGVLVGSDAQRYSGSGARYTSRDDSKSMERYVSAGSANVYSTPEYGTSPPGFNNHSSYAILPPCSAVSHRQFGQSYGVTAPSPQRLAL